MAKALKSNPAAGEQTAPAFTPSIGRIVRYVHAANEEWAATIAAVLEDGKLNLACHTPDAMPVARNGVELSDGPVVGKAYYPAWR